MCGFVGFKSVKGFKILSNDLTKANFCLEHRGPDDSGFFFDERNGVGLGHRRLSVIDLSNAGRQPMSSLGGKVHVVYNGEVYNFREIRKTLEAVGHRFSSNTDTEVVLNAYLQWGVDCLNHFVGMFAFGLWDGRINRLFLARDRLGIKPIYYHYKPGNFLFASELKALMAFGYFACEVDPASIPLFLHYQYIPSPRSVFKDTFKLLPGHYATYDSHGLQVRSYWESPDKYGKKGEEVSEEANALDRLDELLTRAVSDRLVSDVPLGAMLSGGIDSSTVVAMMQKVNSSPVKTFSIGFEESGYNEAPWASRVAKHLGTEHTELYTSPGEALEVVPHLPEIYDEPFADPSAIPTFLVCRLARSSVTVALSGDGGDEQFSGYVRYWGARSLWQVFKWVPKPLRWLLLYPKGFIPHEWVKRHYSSWERFLPAPLRVANFPDKWEKFVAMAGQANLPNFYRTTISLWPIDELYTLTGKHLPQSAFEAAFHKTEGWSLLNRFMYVDQKTYLPDAMLTKVDRASMAVSLEVRVPLIDHRLVEFTSRLSDGLKYRGGTGKYLLKRLLAQYIPEPLFDRPKMGFGVPLDTWFRGALRSLLTDYLSPARLKREGLFDCELVEKKVNEHLSGRANHQYRLWALLMWEMWRDKWLGPGAPV